MTTNNIYFNTSNDENLQFQAIPDGKIAIGIDIMPNKIYLLMLEKISSKKCRLKTENELNAVNSPSEANVNYDKKNIQNQNANFAHANGVDAKNITKQFKVIYSAHLDIPADTINGHELIDIDYLSVALKSIWPKQLVSWNFKQFDVFNIYTVMGVCPSLIHSFESDKNTMLNQLSHGKQNKQKKFNVNTFNAKQKVEADYLIELAVAKAIENHCGINADDLAIDWHLNNQTGKVAMAYIEKHHITNRIELMKKANLPLTTITDTRGATVLACHTLLQSLDLKTIYMNESSIANLNANQSSFDIPDELGYAKDDMHKRKHINKRNITLDMSSNQPIASCIWINAINGQSWTYSLQANQTNSNLDLKNIIAFSELIPIIDNNSNIIYDQLIESMRQYSHSIIVIAGENVNIINKEKLFNKNDWLSDKASFSNTNQCELEKGFETEFQSEFLANYEKNYTDFIGHESNENLAQKKTDHYFQLHNKIHNYRNRHENLRRFQINENKSSSLHAKVAHNANHSTKHPCIKTNQINFNIQDSKQSDHFQQPNKNTKQNMFAWYLPHNCSSDLGQFDAKWATVFGLAMTGLMQ